MDQAKSTSRLRHRQQPVRLDLPRQQKNFYPPHAFRIPVATAAAATALARGPLLFLFMPYAPLHHRPDSADAPAQPVACWQPLLLLLASLGPIAGCSSAISMRDSLRASVEQAAAMTQIASLTDLSTEAHGSEPGPIEVASYAPEPPAGPTYAELADTLADDPAAVAVAIEEAINDLGDTRALDTASKAALIQTLEMTPQSDWPVVIEEFTLTLAALRTPTEPDSPSGAFDTPSPLTTEAEVSSPAALPQAVTDESSPPASESVADETPASTGEQAPTEVTAPASAEVEPLPPTAGGTDQPATDAPTAVVTAPTSQPPAAIDPAADDSVTAVTPAASDLSTPNSDPPFCIGNPCLARNVHGWGIVDRFSPADLKPGAEVIVYFELTGLEATPAATGVVTSVGTTLHLEDCQGNRLHTWSFPPLTETCAAARRDYFARYVVELPAQLPAGDNRLVLSVTDLQTQRTTEAVLTLPVQPSSGATTLAQD